MNYDELQILTQRIEKHPRDPEAYFFRGQLLEVKNFLEDARNDYLKALKLNTKHFHAYMSNLLLERKMKEKKKIPSSHSNDSKQNSSLGKSSQTSSKDTSNYKNSVCNYIFYWKDRNI